MRTTNKTIAHSTMSLSLWKSTAGPGWSVVKKFDRTKNGRATVLALKIQAEGTSAKLTRKQADMPRLQVRWSKRRSLIFLKGILDPVLNTGKSIVFCDSGKLGNFEESQQYLNTIFQNMAAQSKNERNVSSVSE